MLKLMKSRKRIKGKALKPSAAVRGSVIFTLLAATLAMIPAAFAEDKPVPPAVTAGKAVKLSGYTQILGTLQKAGQDSLTVRRSRFSLSADLLKNFKAKFAIDVVRTPVLVDAMVDVIFAEYANLRFGQFMVPFGVESVTSTADLDTINRSQPVDKLAPGRDIGTLGRDVGVMMTGKVSVFDYSVGLFNGSGANKADTNDEKDFAGRVGVKPVDFLTVGASLYKGKYNSVVGAALDRRDRTGIDAAVALGDVSLKGEYIWGVDGKTDRRGWFVQAGWFVLPKQLQILAKFDAYDKDVDRADDGTNLYTAGLNWIFSDKTKIQLNYEYLRNELSQTVNQALLVQFQAAF
ncbi:MAG: porin [Candidatus Aminicenantes bacterium]|nr:porin [Candidatus Aminicenantes bacterium]